MIGNIYDNQTKQRVIYSWREDGKTRAKEFAYKRIRTQNDAVKLAKQFQLKKVIEMKNRLIGCIFERTRLIGKGKNKGKEFTSVRYKWRENKKYKYKDWVVGKKRTKEEAHILAKEFQQDNSNRVIQDIIKSLRL